MNATDPDATEADELLSIDALRAGTVALMTASADLARTRPWVRRTFGA